VSRDTICLSPYISVTFLSAPKNQGILPICQHYRPAFVYAFQCEIAPLVSLKTHFNDEVSIQIVTNFSDDTQWNSLEIRKGTLDPQNSTPQKLFLWAKPVPAYLVDKTKAVGHLEHTLLLK